MGEYTRRGAVFLLASGVGALVTSCTTKSSSTETDVSRTRIYGSLAEMVEFSTTLVTGTVVGSEVITEDEGHTTITLSRLAVGRAFAPKALGKQQGAPSNPTGQILIAQFGGGAEAPNPDSPILQQGRRYLLFLRPSGLDGAKSAWLYITGVSAGMYMEGKPGTFDRAATGPDRLPASVTEAQIAQI